MHDNDNLLSDITVCLPVNSNSNFVNNACEHTCNAGINEIYICDNTFSDSCLFESDTSLDIQNFGINYCLEIDEIADFHINLDFLNNISFCENDANCINAVNSTLINIIDQFSEKKLESSIVKGTDGENTCSCEYESNQIVSNSNSEENLLFYNDTSVNSNHVVIDVNRSIVCNEIQTVANVSFEYDFNMLSILYVNCCGLVNKLYYPEFENLIEKHNIVCFVETKTNDMDEIKLPGYKFHMKNRKTNSRVKSGGDNYWVSRTVDWVKIKWII